MQNQDSDLSMSGPHQQPPVDPEVGLLDVEEGVGPQIVLAGDGVDTGTFEAGTFKQIGGGMATLLVLVAATYLIPALHFARPWTRDDPMLFWNLVGRELMGEGAAMEESAESLVEAEAIAKAVEAEEDAPIVDRKPVRAEDGKLPPYEPHPDDAQDVPRALDLPSETALDPFFAQLARTDAGFEHALTRVSHYGDSVIASDNVTSTLRLKMQHRFGDGGHGFHLITRGIKSYRHKGIRWEGSGWKRCYIINKCIDDGYYGFGGTTVWSAGGAQSTFSTETSGAMGRKVSRFELFYAGQPDGGNIRIRVDGGEGSIVPTAAEQLEDRWYTVRMPDGAHNIEVRAMGEGKARLYGVVMERDGPGVVWDGVAQLGAFSNRMLYFDADHIASQIEHRDPSLLVFQFGGNDLSIRRGAFDKLKTDFAAVIERFRGQDQPPACLVVSPVDHGHQKGQQVASHKNMKRITALQRDVALAQGCAFFDTFAAMGGDGAAGRWRKRRLLSGDLSHLTKAGQRVVGQMIYLALMKGYRDYRARID